MKDLYIETYTTSPKGIKEHLNKWKDIKIHALEKIILRCKFSSYNSIRLLYRSWQADPKIYVDV